jgi:hypothetical protein
MENIKDELVSFETAKLAKVKGFDLECLDFYGKDIILKQFELFQCQNRCKEHRNSNNPISISAPTQALLQRWLRETKGLHIELGLVDSPNDYWVRVDDENGSALETTWNKDPSIMLKTYEQALEYGLFEALKTLN